VLVTRVRLHRSCRLRALTAKTQAKLTHTLDVDAVLTSQNYTFRNLADCVHDSILLAIGKLEVGWDQLEWHEPAQVQDRLL
jgi:hypothetical protein